MSRQKLRITLEHLPTGEYRAEAELPGWESPMRSGDYDELDGALASLARSLIHHRDALGRARLRRTEAAIARGERKALPESTGVRLEDWLDD